VILTNRAKAFYASMSVVSSSYAARLRAAPEPVSVRAVAVLIEGKDDSRIGLTGPALVLRNRRNLPRARNIAFRRRT